VAAALRQGVAVKDRSGGGLFTKKHKATFQTADAVAIMMSGGFASSAEEAAAVLARMVDAGLVTSPAKGLYSFAGAERDALARGVSEGVGGVEGPPLQPGGLEMAFVELEAKRIQARLADVLKVSNRGQAARSSLSTAAPVRFLLLLPRRGA
jgi:hypothetical protein